MDDVKYRREQGHNILSFIVVKKDNSTKLGAMIYKKILQPLILQRKRAKFKKSEINMRILFYTFICVAVLTTASGCSKKEEQKKDLIKSFKRKYMGAKQPSNFKPGTLISFKYESGGKLSILNEAIAKYIYRDRVGYGMFEYLKSVPRG